MRVEQHTITLDQVPVFFRTAGADVRAAEVEAGDGPTTRVDAGAPILYLHGAPTSSDDWIPFLERTGGIAPDLIGFGRSGKGGHLDYSPESLTAFVERFLDEVGVGRLKLVGHDWGGAIAALLAARDPDRVERLVLIDAVPLLEGFTWHRPARVFRRPLLGELAMGSATRSVLARTLRQAAASPQAWSDARLATVWEQFDQGTQRALLRLHRAADEGHLAELGGSLSGLEVPALVVWGERDPWFGPELAHGYVARLRHATQELIAGAGHWPWMDDSAVIDIVARFLAGP